MKLLDPNNFKVHLRDKHPFPRGGLRLYPALNRRGDAQSITDMDMLQRFTALKKDVFINIFSEDQKRSKTYDCIFLDIDYSDAGEAFRAMLQVCILLDRAGVRHYYVAFSGSKGYHVYVPFETVLLSDYSRAVRTWLHKAGILTLIDTACIEPNRVSRVIGSQNLKSGAYCVYVGDNYDYFDFNEILENSKIGISNAIPDIQYNDLSVLREYDRITVRHDNATSSDQSSKIFSKVRYYPDCMLKLYQEALEGTDLGHIERLELGKFLLYVHGGDVDFVSKVYMGMSDFDPKKTEYQLNYINSKNLSMTGCDKLMANGICPYSKHHEAEMNCPFYPSLHKHIRRELENESP